MLLRLALHTGLTFSRILALVAIMPENARYTSRIHLPDLTKPVT
jgi:hypothetical protein